MNPTRYDLIAVGEVLIDLISEQMAPGLEQAEQFRRFFGGQVANVAGNVSLLGGRAAVVGCVGADGFGRFLRQELNRAGVETSYLHEVTAAPTTLSFIVRHTATPDFIIYRGADALLSPPDIPAEAIAQSRAVHASAFSLSREPSRSAVLHALRVAREANCLVSLDPNYHPRVWDDTVAPLEVLEQAYAYVNVAKPSWDDCQRIFGSQADPEACISRFLEWGAELVVLTAGRKGALLALQSGERWKMPAHDIAVSDVTGAGDAFWAGLLLGLLDGLPPRRAAQVGQFVAERKLRAFGPLREPLNRAEIYRALWSDVAHPES
jgi:sugar/nucleoside kinase (ribokinase family)